MRGFGHIAALLLPLMAAIPLAAQEHLAVRSERVLLDVQPGQIVTTTFRIENRDLDDAEFVALCPLPAGWKSITDDLPFFVPRGEREIRIFSLAVPALAPAGEYPLLYRVSSRAWPEISDSQTITVRVLSSSRLELEPLQVPEFAFAGDTVRTSFRLVNRSNREQWIALAAMNAELAGDSLIQVAAGAAAIVEARYRVPPRLASVTDWTIGLTARFPEDSGTALQRSVRLTLMPRRTSRRHDLALPGSARLSYYHYQNSILRRDGLQGDLGLKGWLDRNRRHQLDLRLRGPDQYRVSTLGQHDEYYAAYIHPSGSFAAGDQGFSLSELTELYKYGRGVQAAMTRAGLSAGAFSFKSRFYHPNFIEQGAFVQYQINPAGRLRLNYLHKEKGELRKADVVSAEAGFSLCAHTALTLEAAAGHNAGRTATASRLEVRSVIRRLLVNGYYVHSGEGFPGYYQNTNMANLALNLELATNLLFDLNFHRDYQNADLDTTLYSAPFTRTLQSGLSYRPAGGTSLRFYFCDSYQQDRLPQAKFDYGQQSIRLQADQAWSRLSLQAIAESGVTQNHLPGYSAADQRMFSALAAVRVRLRRQDGVGGYLRYSDNNRYGGTRLREVLAGVNGDLRIRERTSLNFSWRSGYTLEEYYLDRNILELGLLQDLEAGRSVDLRARYTLLRNSLDRREFAAALHATLPFNLPLPVKKKCGTLHGRILRLDGSSSAGLILHLGEAAAVTQADGSYRFTGITPGNYPLLIDPRGLTLHEVILEKAPAVTITAGGDEMLNLSLCRSAQLDGRIVAGQAEGKGAPDFSAIIVELQDGTEATRVYCDREGRFRLTDLRPGRYTLTLYDQGLEGWQLRDKTQTLALAPGEVRHIDFSAAVKLRTVLFQQGWKNAAEP